MISLLLFSVWWPNFHPHQRASPWGVLSGGGGTLLNAFSDAGESIT